MRIAIVSGSLPPNRCGVGDYTQCLAEALRAKGICVDCIGGEPWSSVRALAAIRSALQGKEVDLLHLQYPTMGFGRSLIPAVLPLMPRHVPFAVTLHEFSSFRAIRRPWFSTFARAVDLRLFTSVRELSAFRGTMRPRSGEDLVIPIGSNIPVGIARKREPGTICYFGLLSPYKGLEQFLNVADAARGRPWRFSIIGATPIGSEAYATSILDRARSLGVSLFLDLDSLEVSRVLCSQELAYLPFSASMSRGSLLAAMGNGAVVVTRHGKDSTDAIRLATVHVEGTVENVVAIVSGLLGDPARCEHLRRLASSIPLGWNDIAEAHASAYASAIAARRFPGLASKTSLSVCTRRS